MTQIQALNETDLRAYYNSDKQIFYIHYIGTLTSETTKKAYAWLFQNGLSLGIANIRAFIFDFTEVTQFRRDNTIASKNESQTANQVVDLSRIPAALIVKTINQEQMVLLSMKVNGVEERTKICKTHAHAMTFIDQFHRNLAKRDAAQTKKVTKD